MIQSKCGINELDSSVYWLVICIDNLLRLHGQNLYEVKSDFEHPATSIQISDKVTVVTSEDIRPAAQSSKTSKLQTYFV